MGGPGEMISVSINGNHRLIDKILKAKTNKTKEVPKSGWKKINNQGQITTIKGNSKSLINRR